MTSKSVGSVLDSQRTYQQSHCNHHDRLAKDVAMMRTP